MWSMSRIAIIALRSLRDVVRDFDQVRVRIAKVYGPNRSGGAGPCNRSVDDFHVGGTKVFDDGIERLVRDQAEVDRAGGRPVGLRLEFASRFMQVELMPSEGECLAA